MSNSEVSDLTITASNLENILKKFSGKKILVIGDLIWDEYIHGDVERISPEAPVPILLSQSEKRIPGGATNVLRNLVDLKVSAGIMGVVGADSSGHDMVRTLRGWNLETVEIWESADRPTIIKTRILARNQQLLRLDREVVKPISKEIEQRMLSTFALIIHRYDAVILSDYDKGVLTPFLIHGIIEKAKEHGKFLAVDPQTRHFRNYTGADLMTPNEKEASVGIGEESPKTDEEILKLGCKIKSELKLKHLLLTRSHKGMAVFNEDSISFVPTVAQDVFDVTGAGDTVIAVYTSAIVAKANPIEAALIANIAGGVVVGKLGTATVKRKELATFIKANALKFTNRKIK